MQINKIEVNDALIFTRSSHKFWKYFDCSRNVNKFNFPWQRLNTLNIFMLLVRGIWWVGGMCKQKMILQVILFTSHGMHQQCENIAHNLWHTCEIANFSKLICKKVGRKALQKKRKLCQCELSRKLRLGWTFHFGKIPNLKTSKQ